MMLIGIALKASTEQWAERMRQDSPLGHATRNGELTPRALALYLESLRYLFAQSHRSIELAAERAAQLDCADLAKHFERKAQEESGHDRWAISDLAQLPPAVTQGLAPAAAIVRLVELQRTLIAEHPLYFAVYALWAEYFTVLLGDEWLDALAKYGYDRSKLSAVSKHVEADREHAARGFSEIDQLCDGQPSQAALMDAVERAQRGFEAFCQEICAEARSAA